MRFVQSLRSAISIYIFLSVHATSVLAADSNATLSSDASGKTVALKILPLGDSITYGYQSTDGNGYRKHLLDKITTNGTAQYIGSVRSGDMSDNHNEGHPGATITEISAFSRNSLALRPNLILLMAGTNDMNLNLSLGASERLASLVDMCSTHCPDAVILLAQLTPAATTDVEARVEQFNPSVVSIAASREKRGMKVAVIDMPKSVTTADLKDDLHPNDAGYAKMADAWFEGIQQAASKGWFTQPVDGIGPPRDVGPASVLSSTAAVFFASTVSLVASSSSVVPTFTNSSRATAVAATTNMPLPTSFPIPTSSSTFSNSPVIAAPTQPPVPSVAIASLTATNVAGPSRGQRRSHFASSFAVAGLGVLLWGF